MRMTLDLLHEFANTEVFCLFRNCMWQSRHSEVEVYFLALCEQTDGLFTFNGFSPFLFDLRLRFRLRLCLDLNVQQTLAHTTVNKSSCSCIGAFAVKQDTFVTGLTVLTSGFLVFGWVCWES